MWGYNRVRANSTGKNNLQEIAWYKNQLKMLAPYRYKSGNEQKLYNLYLYKLSKLDGGIYEKSRHTKDATIEVPGYGKKGIGRK